MKNPLIIILVVVIVVGGWFLFKSDTDQSSTQEGQTASEQIQYSDTLLSGADSLDPSQRPGGAANNLDPSLERPAAEVYSSAEEALAAVRAGAQDYDDLILEQFVLPGEDCQWCDSFYSSVTELMKAESASPDEKAYYSEILSISGRPENLESLVEALREAGDSEDADIFAESLELTIGNDEVARFLSQYLSDENELVQESSVAAITNQGSLVAAEVIYEHTRQKGDADGYYSLGIGLGEMIPEQESLPYLQEKVLQRDEYSHLALKALLNQGHDGLTIVVDTLTNTPNADFDRQMLEDAVDHVDFDDQSIAYLNNLVANSNQPLVVEFAKEVLADFEEMGDLYEEGDEYEDGDYEDYEY